MKTENIIQNQNAQPVSEVLLEHAGAIEILNKYHIDYCCGGKSSFAEACYAVGANPEVIYHEILEHEALVKDNKQLRFENWSAPLLADFIVQNHHTYVRESIPQILELLEKVCDAHGDDYPALDVLRDDFKKLSEDLELHMKKEELLLFPAIQRLYNSGMQEQSDIESLQQTMGTLEDEHKDAGHLLKSIRTLTSRYTPPPDACPTFVYAYQKLEEFDNDLMQHIHLENNILFEKVFL